MKKVILLVAVLIAITAPAFLQAAAGDSAVESKIAANEKALWDGWKNHDPKSANEYLTDNTINIVTGEVDKGKAQTVKAFSSTDCKVNDYSLSDFSYMWLDKDTVIVNYNASQDAECKGQKVPGKVVATSVWQKKDGKWVTPFHQETPAM